MPKGMTTCKICQREFALIAEDRYTVRDTDRTGLAAAFAGGSEATWYDAFDCPHCGCQNIVQARKRPVREFILEAEEGEVAHGCEGCEYDKVAPNEAPCDDCIRNLDDHYKKEENDGHGMAEEGD